MFLKTHRVRKDGKLHVYYSLCESLRVSRSRVTQRTVLHLGELNTTQLDCWQRSIEIVDEDGQRYQMRLFTDREWLVLIRPLTLDRMLAHKEALERHLAAKWRDLFGAEFDVLL
jgi:negative regulator of sigma E activity